jgi:hypothetical protein
VVQGPTTVFNPSLSVAEIEAQTAADPVAARSEWLAEFRTDLQSFLTDDLVDRAVDYARPLELPPLRGAGLFYKAFCDSAGGTGRDAYSLCIAHREADVVVVDVVRATTGAFDPQQVTEQYAKLVKEYNAHGVAGDRYAALWTASAWDRCGVTSTVSDIPKSQIYLESLPWWTRGRVLIPDHPRLIRELRLLERSTGRNRDVVDHPRGGHDDCANALCGVLRLLSDALGDYDLTTYRKAWDPSYATTDPARERAEIAMRRFMAEIAARDKARPLIAWDLPGGSGVAPPGTPIEVV